MLLCAFIPPIPPPSIRSVNITLLINEQKKKGGGGLFCVFHDKPDTL